MASFTPLGDQAVLARFELELDALRFAAAVRAGRLPGVVDVVSAYTTVAVFYDLNQTRYASLAARLEELPLTDGEAPPGSDWSVPCCYEFGPDLPRVAEFSGRSESEVIDLHCRSVYTVYAIGFCPGFPYLGYLPEALCGVPRLPSPRLRVEPGSVGLTGRQTGIYPLERPGGWNLIGRTPLTLVDVAKGSFPIRVGDRVRFVPIDRGEFERRRGQPLS